MKMSELIKPTDRQRQFLDAVKKCKYILYGGAAGGGKSYILRWTLVLLLLKWAAKGHRGVRVGLFCEDYPSLRERHISKVKYEFPSWLGKMKESTHEFELDDKFGGGVICFRNLDDPSKYLSAEFAAIAVDELTKNEETIFHFLRMRIRWPGIPEDETKFLGATNPGGVGHAWVRKLFVDKKLPVELQSMKDLFAFIPAKASDNPHLPTGYTDMLQTLPEQMRKAYADGSWDVFHGQVFSEWDPEKHVVKPFPIEDSWLKFSTLDWGYAKPYASYWIACDNDGRLILYREIYGCVDGQVNTGVRETASVVAGRIKKAEKKDETSYRVADPSIWAKSGTTGPAIVEEFEDEEVFFIKGDNDRLARKMQFHERLADGMFVVFDTCTEFIRTFPALVYDKYNKEDVDTTQEDHPYDSVGYGLMSRPYTPSIEKREKAEEDRYAARQKRRQEESKSWMAG